MTAQQPTVDWIIEEVATLPEGVSNNAVAQAEVNGTPFIYSFSGIDNTKIRTGIHLKSWKYNTLTGEVTSLPDLPDTRGKIAAAASQVGDIIYVTGGYYVMAGGSEESSALVHRFDTRADTFLADGAPTPVPTDDHVQLVWRDSLIYCITGWSNSTNIPDVQIYDPTLDRWQVGTSVPNNDNYKSFGSGATILGDTMYYFGGAESTFPTGNPFPIQSGLRRGIISREDPTQIDWTLTDLSPEVGYRTAGLTHGGRVYWLGGSDITYNFNAIAYRDGRAVQPSRDIVEVDPLTGDVAVSSNSIVPMDLRQIAQVSDSVYYIMGGMQADRQVSAGILRVTARDIITSSTDLPARDLFRYHQQGDQLYLYFDEPGKKTITIFTTSGTPILQHTTSSYQAVIDISHLPAGAYVMSGRSESGEGSVVWVRG